MTHERRPLAPQPHTARLPSDIHTVAALAKLRVRTLQRRLHDQGVTFAWLVARARLDRAQGMLADPARRIIDVALDLGYSDPAHFTRAFVRWTGIAPREFRRFRWTERSGSAWHRFKRFDLVGQVTESIWDDNIGLQPTGLLLFAPARQPGGDCARCCSTGT
jgi:AraC-like DNA-binding protein